MRGQDWTSYTTEWYSLELQSNLRWLASFKNYPNTNAFYSAFYRFVDRSFRSQSYRALNDYLIAYRALGNFNIPDYMNALNEYLTTLSEEKRFCYEYMDYFVTYLQNKQEGSYLSQVQLLAVLNTIQEWVDTCVPPETIQRYLKEMAQYDWSWVHPKQALMNYVITEGISGDKHSILFNPNAFKKFVQLKQSCLYFQEEGHGKTYIDALFHRALAMQNVHPLCTITQEKLAFLYETLLSESFFDEEENRLMLAEILSTLRNQYRFIAVIRELLGNEAVSQLLQQQPEKLREDEIEESLLIALREPVRLKALHEACNANNFQNYTLKLSEVRIIPTLLEMTVPKHMLYKQAKQLCMILQQHEKSKIGPFKRKRLLAESKAFTIAYECLHEPENHKPSTVMAQSLLKQFTSVEALCRDYIMRLGKALYNHVGFIGGTLGGPEESIREVSPAPKKELAKAVSGDMVSYIDKMILPGLIAEEHQALKRFETQAAEVPSDQWEAHQTKIRHLQNHLSTLTARYRPHLTKKQRALNRAYQHINEYMKLYVGLDNVLFKEKKNELQKQLNGEHNTANKEALVEQFLALACAWLYQNQSILIRPTQLLGVLSALKINHIHQLLQMDTGEGKTVLLELYTLAKAFQGENVDIFTNTVYMARDEIYPKFRSFAVALGFSIGCPYVDGDNAYRKQIVVVDAKADIIHQMRAEYNSEGPRYMGITNEFPDVNVDPQGIRKSETLLFDEVDTALDQLYSSVNVLSGEPYPPEVQIQFHAYFTVSNCAMAVMSLLKTSETDVSIPSEYNRALYRQLIEHLLARSPLRLESDAEPAIYERFFEELLSAIPGRAALHLDMSNEEEFKRTIGCMRLVSELGERDWQNTQDIVNWLNDSSGRWLLDFNSASTAFAVKKEVDYDVYAMNRKGYGKDTPLQATADQSTPPHQEGLFFEINIIHQATSGDRDQTAVWTHGVHQRVALIEQGLLKNSKDKINIPALKKQLAQNTIVGRVSQYNNICGVTGTLLGNQQKEATLKTIFSKNNQAPCFIMLERFEAHRRYDSTPIVFDDDKSLHETMVDYILSELSAMKKPSLLIVFTTERSLNHFLRYIQETPKAASILPNLLNVTGDGVVNPLQVKNASRPGTVSFTTSIGGRAVDYQRISEVIKCFDDPDYPFDEAQEHQAAGRAGRSGKVGKSRVFATRAAIRLPQAPEVPRHHRRPLINLSEITQVQPYLKAMQTSVSNRIAEQAREKCDKAQEVQRFQQLYKKARHLLLSAGIPNDSKAKQEHHNWLCEMQQEWQACLNEELLPLLSERELSKGDCNQHLENLFKQLETKLSRFSPNLLKSAFKTSRNIGDPRSRRSRSPREQGLFGSPSAEAAPSGTKPADPDNTKKPSSDY